MMGQVMLIIDTRFLGMEQLQVVSLLRVVVNHADFIISVPEELLLLCLAQIPHIIIRDIKSRNVKLVLEDLNACRPLLPAT